MRQDMSKVLIERPRTQSSEPSRKWGKHIRIVHEEDYNYEDELIGKISSARHRQYGYDCRHSTDLLGPLQRYLRSKVGQPWDEVYSEICANLDKRKTTGAHVFTHIWQYVERNCWVGVSGTVYSNGGGRPYRYYVHPFTGLLCDSENEGWSYWRRNRKKVPVTFIELSTDTCYIWMKGVWYFANWKWNEEVHYSSIMHKYYRTKKERVYYNKRQLNKKELRDLKLSNARLDAQ